jgi:serine/threonine-protein kinase HipA
VAQTDIVSFGARRVLVVERFDRSWRHADHIIRLPQEDGCQALGFLPTFRYQNDGGPNMRDIFGLLKGADDAQADQIAFFKSQILFWLIGATDVHAKNFSIFLKPGGRYSLTPFYDVLSAQPAVDRGQIARNKFRLAMSAGNNCHYRMSEVMGRHFVQTGKAAGLGSIAMRAAITDLLDRCTDAPEKALAAMPKDFARQIHESIAVVISKRLPHLASAHDEL